MASVSLGVLSLIEIEILLWYARNVFGDCRDATTFALGNLLGTGLLEVPDNNAVWDTPRYRITERGRVYARALQQVPLPTAVTTVRWVTTWPKDEAPQ